MKKNTRVTMKRRTVVAGAAVKLLLRSARLMHNAVRGLTVSRAADLVHDCMVRGAKKSRPYLADALKRNKAAFKLGAVAAAGGADVVVR
jgi:hypothetical protein